MKDLRWTINRLRTMSVVEILFRCYRAARTQLEAKGFGLAKPVLPATDKRPATAADFLVSFPNRSDDYVAAADKILAGESKVFAHPVVLGNLDWNRDPSSGKSAPMSFGKKLNYRNQDLVGDIKYLWEPNRHLHLVTVSQAYRLTREQRYFEFITHSLSTWLTQCPYPFGPNWCSSLELAIRLINWSIIWRLIEPLQNLKSRDSGEAQLLERWLANIYQHCHFISKYHSRFTSANNHLIGEAAGLYVAAVTWPYWPESSMWQKRGKDILVRESCKQVYPDGATKEQAIGYQQFVLDFLLLPGLFGRNSDDPFPDEYWALIRSMMHFIASIMDCKHNVPMLGDSDDGFVVHLSSELDFDPFRSLLATGAILFDDPYLKMKSGGLDEKTIWLLGVSAQDRFDQVKHEPSTPCLDFLDAGYCQLGSRFDTQDEVRILVDTGPLGYKGIAAHGHADALSLTLNVSGDEVLVDPGTYAYHTKQIWRDYFRGTAAHNTVRVDGLDQSVPGGPFMWLHHAQTRCLERESSPSKDIVIAEHDGYRRLNDPVIHRRQILFDKHDNTLLVTDTLTCRGTHKAEIFWHFSEQCRVQLSGNEVIAHTDRSDTVLTPLWENAVAEIYNGDERRPLGWISRRFDEKIPTTTIAYAVPFTGTATLQTQLRIRSRT